MADIKSISGNPIKVGTSGIEDGAVTDAKLAGYNYSSSDIIRGGVGYDGSFISSEVTLRGRTLTEVTSGDVVVIHPGNVCDSVVVVQFDENRINGNNIGWYTRDICYIANDGYILPLFRKSSNETIQADEYDAEFTISRGGMAHVVAELSEKTVTDLGMQDVYEFAEISAMGNSYDRYKPGQTVTRARVKKEHIQRIPDGAKAVSVSIKADSFAGDKYKCAYISFDENYTQITAGSSAWITSESTVALTVPDNAKYYMIYYAVNSASEINLSEINNNNNVVYFDNSNIDYNKNQMFPSVKTLYPSILEKITDIGYGEPFILSVNHRGYSAVAPENTLPAYIMSKKVGFSWVETDIEFTSDGVPVLMHDATINRTGRNADGSAISSQILVHDITYEQLQTYDFGIWKGSEWAGVKCPTLREYLVTCKRLALGTFLDIKDDVTQGELQIIIDTVKSTGMDEHVVYGAFMASHLEYIKSVEPNASMGIGAGVGIVGNQDAFDSLVETIQQLRTGTNNVFMSAGYTYMTDEYYNQLIDNNIPICVWTINTENDALNIHDSVFAAMSDSLNIGKILMKHTIDSL